MDLICLLIKDSAMESWEYQSFLSDGFIVSIVILHSLEAKV